MKVTRREAAGKSYFTVSDLDPLQSRAVKDLDFQEVEGGFARIFSMDSPALNKVYSQFALHVEKIILQATGLVNPDWESALESTAEKLIDISEWWLTGSAALAVRGIDVLPRDIDVVVATGQDAQRIGDTLSDWLVEPVQRSEGWVARWFGRAFKHARIEWVGEVESWVDQTGPSDFGPVAASRLETVRWKDYDLRVPPLELQLAVSERRGMNEKATKIRRAIR